MAQAQAARRKQEQKLARARNAKKESGPKAQDAIAEYRRMVAEQEAAERESNGGSFLPRLV